MSHTIPSEDLFVEALKVGDRVTVRILHPIAYAVGAVASLDGKTGTVTSLPASGSHCVEFDSPARPWHNNQAPCRAFHFDRSELVKQ
jgi:hypothetical protein